MRIQNSLVIFSLYTLSFVFSKQTVTDGKDLGTIISANVLFRHGHRTPTECYPNDPYNNVSYWPDGWGQLTNIGKMQQYELGRWLRVRYNHLLSDIYSRDEIHIRSTDVDRTLMSAEANLAGLYPPKDPQVWSPNIKWQPIPVHTAPEHLDDLLAMGKPCKRYQAEYKKVMTLAPVVDFFEANSELLDYLTTHTGLHVTDLGQALNLWSTMYIETLRNYTLPEWTSKIFPEPLKTVAAHHYTFETYTTELKKLKSGPLLKDMLEHFKVRLGVSEITLPIEEMALMKSRKVYIYSGHDETIGTLLSSLGIFNMKNPPFASAVLVELRERDHAHFVTVTYRNSSTEAHVMAIPGCSKMCPYERFIELTANIIPFDWEAECSRSHIFDLTTELPYNSLAVFVMVTSTLLVFLLLASMSIFWQKQKPTRLYKKLKTDSI